jgi:heme exporter protein D
MLGKYAAYILPAYGLSALVIGGLFVWTLVVYRQRQKEIAALEARGAKRRSAARSDNG